MVARKGYKLTEVGEIPEDWEVTPIGEITEKVGSGITPTGGQKVYSCTGRPFMRSQNVGWGKLLLDDIVFISDEIHAGFPDTELKLHDLLLNITGASIGRCAIADKNIVNGNVNQHVCIIRTKKSKIESSLLCNIVLSSVGQKQIDNFQTGGNRQGLNFVQVRSIQVPVPPTLKEQTAIATALSDADALIDALEQSIAKKRNIKQGAMQELLTGKRRLPGFAKKWTIEVLNGLVDTDPESLLSGTEKAYTFNYIALEDVNCGELTQYSEYQFCSAPVRARRKISCGDLLIATVRPNLKSHLLFSLNNGEWVCSTGFCVVRCKENKIDNKYLFQHFFASTINTQIENVMTGSNYPAINSATVRALEIPTPPTLEEQTAIATVLSDMDDEIAALEAKLAKARQIKQGMMQELLTGRIRLI